VSGELDRRGVLEALLFVAEEPVRGNVKGASPRPRGGVRLSRRPVGPVGIAISSSDC
jgi:hypothetical protein